MPQTVPSFVLLLLFLVHREKVTRTGGASALSQPEQEFVLVSIVLVSCTKSMELIHHVLNENGQICLNTCVDFSLQCEAVQQDLSKTAQARDDPVMLFAR